MKVLKIFIWYKQYVLSKGKKKRGILDLFVSYKQTQLDVMLLFKKVHSSHHKFILRGKDIPTDNTDKCSAESVHFPLTIGFYW